MTDLAPGDRPREKLERAGVDALGDNELVALVLGHGQPGANALATANRLLEVSAGVAGLTRVHRRQLLRVPGIGPAQASRVLAAVELGRRTLLVKPGVRPRFPTALDMAKFLLPKYGAYPVERFGVMLLDTKLRLVGVELVSVGGLDASLADPRDVFRVAIAARASALVLFHNHPSGDPTPSIDDVRLTQRLAAAGEVVGIDVIDHVVLADQRYRSFREMENPAMARVMYFDCFSGAAGDMVLGALLDAGLPLDQLRAALGELGIGHDLHVTRVLRAEVSATHVDVRPSAPQPGGHHDHEEHDHAHDHRSLKDIAHRIGHSSLSPAGKARAVALFQRLGEAEAAIHQVPVEQVHLHEVGAPDSIIDIVGAVFALEWFGIDDIIASPLNVGGGTVRIAHGAFPVPAPATLRLLSGAPVYSSGTHGELVTPTGALLITSYARSYGPMPPMTVGRIGTGAGTRDREGAPNVLRVVIGERTEVAAHAPQSGQGTVLRIECGIDDMNPQLFSPLGDRLVAEGALDVYLTPVLMKKGRPGTLITVLAPPDRRPAICNLLFRETTTIGVRFDAVERDTLDRRWVEVTVAGGVVRVKVAGRGAEVLNAAPEFDDCVRVATSTGRPVKTIQAEALKAWLDRPTS